MTDKPEPDPRFAHSEGSGGDTPNPADEVLTRDDDTDGEHANTRTTGAGVEADPSAVEGPTGAARVEHAPEVAYEALRNPSG